nr:cyclic nucleotide-binding domain-containing protein [Cohnella mopanensis]
MVARTIEVHTFEPESYLFVENDPSSDCYILVQGRVRVTSRNLVGQTLTLAELGAGEIVGEMGLIRREPRSASIVAMEQVVAFRLDYSLFERLADLSPLFYQSMLVNVRLRYIHSLLRKATIWSTIPDSELRGIAEISQLETVKQGHTIVRQGEAITSLYMINSGSVEIRSKGKHAVLREGDFFGETELLTDLPAFYQVKALEDCELLTLDQSFFESILTYYKPVKHQLLTMLSIRNPALLKSVTASYNPEEFKQAEQEKQDQLPQVKDKWIAYLLWLGCGFVGLSFLAFFVSNLGIKIAVLLMGGLFGPVTFVAYVRNQQILGYRGYRLAMIFLLTGLVAIPAAFALEKLWMVAPSVAPPFLGSFYNPIIVAIVEEGCKLLVFFILLRSNQVRFLMDAIVFGAAAGMGFAAIESILYGWTNLQTDSSLSMLVVLWVRTLLSPFGHGTWTAIAAVGLWMGLAKHTALHIQQRNRWARIGMFLGFFAVSISLHTLWNYSYSSGSLRLLAMGAIGAIGIGLLLGLIRRGRQLEFGTLRALNPEDTRVGASSSHADLLCTGCGTYSPPSSRYCTRCGQALRIRAGGKP